MLTKLILMLLVSDVGSSIKNNNNDMIRAIPEDIPWAYKGISTTLLHYSVKVSRVLHKATTPLTRNEVQCRLEEDVVMLSTHQCNY